MEKLKDNTSSRGDKSAKAFLTSLTRGCGFTRSEGRRALYESIILFTIGFLFSGCHLIFGAHPLGIALVSVLPYGVWAAALGAIAGALTLGKLGMIYAMIAVVCVLIRVIISGGQRKDASELFSENLLLRMSAATISGFVAAVYEILLSGIKDTTLMFGLSMILISPILTFMLSGIFSTGIDIYTLISSSASTLTLRGKRDEEKYNVIFFSISSLVALFLITLSLLPYDLFGISASHVFTSLLTLVASKKLGAIRAMTVGFVSSLSLGTASVSFGLLGLGAGALFSLGVPYAMLGGGILLSAWSAYVSGLTGLLSVLPEYAIATALMVPIAPRLPKEHTDTEEKECEKTARDMVGTMALAYQNRYTGALDLLEDSLSSLASLMRSGGANLTSGLSREEYLRIISEVTEEQCRACDSLTLCSEQNVCPAMKRIGEIADMLLDGKHPTMSDINSETEFCQHADKIAERIHSEVARAEEEIARLRASADTAELYELIGKLISDARTADEIERSVDTSLSERLEDALTKHGLPGGVIRAFGTRKRHLILAAEDESGDTVSSHELRTDVERIGDLRLGEPEFIRGGKIAMLECDTRKIYSVECRSASSAADPSEVSGDTVTSFESADGIFYTILSDGMGKGAVAKETSDFVAKFLTRVMDFSPSYDTALHLVNHVMRSRCEECSATVDLFSIDLYTGDATFIKSGAAPSFIKRDSSLFRIRSQTAPLGLVKGIDSERIKVEIRSDDYVIILSDGVAQSAEDAPWLLELLAAPPKKDLGEYADEILRVAKMHSRSRDDMSVTVLKIIRI